MCEKPAGVVRYRTDMEDMEESELQDTAVGLVDMSKNVLK